MSCPMSLGYIDRKYKCGTFSMCRPTVNITAKMSSDRQIIGLFSVTELNGETLGIAFFAHVQDPSGQKQ